MSVSVKATVDEKQIVNKIITDSDLLVDVLQALYTYQDPTSLGHKCINRIQCSCILWDEASSAKIADWLRAFADAVTYVREDTP